MTTLSHQGIGAICASGVETPFALKDGANTLQGNIRAAQECIYPKAVRQGLFNRWISCRTPPDFL